MVLVHSIYRLIGRRSSVRLLVYYDEKGNMRKFEVESEEGLSIVQYEYLKKCLPYNETDLINDAQNSALHKAFHIEVV